MSEALRYISPALRGLAVACKTLRLDSRNARAHPARNMAAIKASLSRFGQQRPIIVDAQGGVVAGNGTLMAARELGWTHIAVVRTDLKGKDAMAYALADNRTAELSDWDLDELRAQMTELRGCDALDAVGFTEAELSERLGEANAELDRVRAEATSIAVRCPECGHRFYVERTTQ